MAHRQFGGGHPQRHDLNVVGQGVCLRTRIDEDAALRLDIFARKMKAFLYLWRQATLNLEGLDGSAGQSQQDVDFRTG
ncbi:hypothetical protein D9M70_619320 [compost metagenome]